MPHEANMIDMRVALDHQRDIVRFQTQKLQLRQRQVFMGQLQHFSKSTKVILFCRGGRIMRVFCRKTRIDQDVFIRRGLDQKAADADDPTIFMHAEKAVIKHRKSFGQTLKEGLHFQTSTLLLDPRIERTGPLKVKIHRLFQYLLEATEQSPEAVVGFSLSASPVLGAFLDDLDPNLPLDWNNRDFRGLPELRAHVLAQAGLQNICQIEDVLITAGAAEANYLALMQLLQPGDEIVVETPGWPQAQVIAAAKGNRVVKVRRRAADGWVLSPDALRHAVTSRTRLIFLSNPNNPTGQVLDRAAMHEIIAIADAVGAWLLVDEVYAGLEWDGPRAPSVAGLYERGITTGSVSKALGLQGLRTGWLICRDPDLNMDAVILRENSSEIMNIMGEVIAEIALRPDRYAAALVEARAAGAANLERLTGWLDAEPNLEWVPPRAGLIGLGRLPTGLNSDAFASRLLAPPYRTFVLPGSAYEEPEHIRLGVGGGAEVNLEKGLERVSAALRDWPA